MYRSNRNIYYLVQVVVGWEYFVSGWNKFAAHGFPQQLAGIINDQIKGMSGWYINFLKSFAIPNAVVFGYLVEYSEVITGFALIVLSLIIIFRNLENGSTFRTLTALLLIASAGDAFMSLNYWFMGGAPSFMPGAQDPTAEGMDIDALMASLAILFVLYNAFALRNSHRNHLLR